VNASGNSDTSVVCPASSVAIATKREGASPVPATFVVDGKGKVVERFDGVPDERRLRRTLGRAGLPPA